MKLVDPTDSDITAVMSTSGEVMQLLGRRIPMTDEGRMQILRIVQGQHQLLCPARRFVFDVERVPGTNWANIIAHELELKDLH